MIESTSVATKDPRKRRWLVAFATSVVILFALLLCVAVLVRWIGPRGFLLATSFLGTLTSLSGLAGFWAGFGRAWWRFLVAPLFLFTLFMVTSFATSGDSPLAFFLFIVGNAVTVFATSIALRLWKGELRTLAMGEESEDALQFGTRDIFIWTAAVAVVIFLVQRFGGEDATISRDLLELRVAGMAVAQAFSIVINIWVFFGRKLNVLKLLVLLGAIVGVGFFSRSLFPNSSPVDFLVTTVVGLAMFAVPVFFLRMGGYRFVKRVGG